jgi:hypothetical protein
MTISFSLLVFSLDNLSTSNSIWIRNKNKSEWLQCAVNKV